MPITSSAKRAHRQSLRRRVYNLRRIRTMQAALKSVRDAAALGKGDMKALERTAFQAIDKAMKRGVIKLNAAARKKSQVSKLLFKTKK